MGNGELRYEPFDPTVANSPMISYYVGKPCFEGCNLVPIYKVDPSTIDQDAVMDKVLQKPLIAIDILINIYNTMKREGTLHQLSGTKLGNFYSETAYFKDRGGLGN